MSNILTVPVPYSKYDQRRADQLKVSIAGRRTETIDKPRYGTIVDIKQDSTQVFVYIQFDDMPPDEFSRDSTGIALPLAHTIEEIALVFGTDLVGLKCKLESSGGNGTTGLIYIIDAKGSGNLETANKLPAFNTIFAPAGGLSV